MKTGIYPDIDINAYHGGVGLSNTGLRDFARSPAHYFGLHLDPNRPAREDKPGQLEGQLAHCATLEPLEFERRYRVGPDVNKNTKIWHSFIDELPKGVIGIKPDQAITALRQALSIHSIPDVKALLDDGMAEVSAYWTDEETGVECRCRPDFVSPAGHGVILLDVKTCSDASPDEFLRQIARKGYQHQDAFYSGGYEIASGLPVLGFVFVAVEAEWPHAACAVMLDDQSRDKAREKNRELLDRFAICQRSNKWPGYSTTIEPVALPAWA